MEKLYSRKIWFRVRITYYKKKVKIGMTDKMCIEAWGEPDSKNRTVLNGKETEQWVYKTNSYLYFDDGILTAIQN